MSTKETIPRSIARLFVFLAIFVFGVAFAEDIWPQFRGPTMNPALADNPNLPDTWSTTENVEWVTDILGRGWSSPVVWGGKVFLTTVVAASETKIELDENGQANPTPPDVEHAWIVYCLELGSGKVLWKKEVLVGTPVVNRHPSGSYASETPATDGERVYFLFGDVGLYCFDMDGNEVWTRDIKPLKRINNYGPGSSPLLYGDKLIMIYDNREASYIAAYDKATGDEMWRTAREEAVSYATPFIWENEFQTEIITSAPRRIRSYDLDGGLLWEMDGRMSWACANTPVASHGMLYLSSGTFKDEHQPAYAIRPGASGDITLSEGQTSSEFVAWYQPSAGDYLTSPLVYRDLYYSPQYRGGFACYDALTGEPVYNRKKIAEKGRVQFSASPWAYNEKVFSLSEQGDTYVVEAGREFKLIRKNSLEEKCFACPAIVGDRLLIRTISKLYSIKKM